MEHTTLTTVCLSTNLTIPLGNKQKHTKDTLK